MTIPTSDAARDGMWWPGLIAQTTVSFVALASVVIFYFSTAAVYDGGVQVFAIMFVVIVLPILTNAVALILGLPIRIGRWAGWWRSHSVLALIGTLMGAVLVVLSWFPFGVRTVALGELGTEVGVFVPFGWTLVLGWLLLAFSLVNTWLPYRWAEALAPVHLPSAE